MQLRKHTINPVRGFSPVFQEKQMTLKTRFIGGPHQMSKDSKITTY